MERTFEHDGATLTVRSATVRSRITRDVLISTLAGRNPGQVVAVIMFADMVSQTALTGGDLNGWTPPILADTDETIQSKFLAWLDLPGEVYDAWSRALRELDAPPLEALDDEKKAPSSTA